MTQSCYSCTHSLTCYMRIGTADLIQSFKLLAEDIVEQGNTQRTHKVSHVWQAIAGACTQYEEKAK